MGFSLQCIQGGASNRSLCAFWFCLDDIFFSSTPGSPTIKTSNLSSEKPVFQQESIVIRDSNAVLTAKESIRSFTYSASLCGLPTGFSVPRCAHSGRTPAVCTLQFKTELNRPRQAGRPEYSSHGCQTGGRAHDVLGTRNHVRWRFRGTFAESFPYCL